MPLLLGLMSANATDPTAPRRIEHLVNFPACGVGVPKSIRGGGLLFNALAAQSQGKYTRFHYVYAGLHGLPADLVLCAAAQAVLGPRLGHAGCVVPADPTARRQLAAGATVRLHGLA